MASSNKTIYKNTMYLYIRMFIMMAISLYSSRIVLQMLGVSDYGLYNVVGGFVAFFFFITSTLATATQRFMAYEMGRKNREGVKKVFSICVFFFIFLSAVILILGLAIGIPYIKYRLNIPEGRESAALHVYIMSLLGAILSFMRVPYNASIIAYEKMSFYSWISIVESVLRLLVIYLLVVANFDKLEFYAFLQLLVMALITLAYYLYCKIKFNDFTTQNIKDTSLIKQLFSYCGWNFINGFADVLVSQGITLILNQFFGTIINAANAIAVQIRAQISNFVNNLSIASAPAIVKSFAAHEDEQFRKILFVNSKLSYFMLLVMSLPFLFILPFVLDIWLGAGNYPAYAIPFTRLTLLKTLMDTIPGFAQTAIQASGRIKGYVTGLTVIKVFSFLMPLILLNFYESPTLAYWSLLLFTIPRDIFVIDECCKHTRIPRPLFYQKVVVPVLMVSLISTIISLFVYNGLESYIENRWGFNVCTGILIFIASTVSCYLVGFSKEEKESVTKFLKSKFGKQVVSE